MPDWVEGLERRVLLDGGGGPAYPSPVLHLNPLPIPLGTYRQGSVSGTVSNPLRSAVISWGDGKADDLPFTNNASGTAASFASGVHDFARAGTYNITVNITDVYGQTAEATATQQLRSYSPPTISASYVPPIPPSPGTPRPTETTITFQVATTFDASPSTTSPPTTVNWGEGSGAEPIGNYVTHTFDLRTLGATQVVIFRAVDDVGQFTAHTYRTQVVSGGLLVLDQGSVSGMVGSPVGTGPAIIRPTGFEASPAGDGWDFRYEIVNADLPAETTAQLFWADGDTPEDELGGPLFVTLTATAVGSYGPIHVPAALLSPAPAAADHLLLVLDPDNLVGTSNVSFKDVAYATPAGTVYPLVSLPDIKIPMPNLEVRPAGVLVPIPDKPAHPMYLHYSELAVDFTVLATAEPGALAEARSSVGTLPMSVYDPGGPLGPLLDQQFGGSTASATVTLFTAAASATIAAGLTPRQVTFTGLTAAGKSTTDNIILNGPLGPGDSLLRWHTDGFRVTMIPRIAGPAIQVMDTGPLTFWVDTNKIGLDPRETTFEAVVRYAEAYIHRTLSQSAFGDHPLLPLIGEFLFIIDPGTTDLLVTGPDGSQAGMTADGTVVRDILGSVYFPDIPLLIIPEPMRGTYTTRVTGRAPGPFLLGSQLIDLGSSTVLAMQSYAATLEQGQSTTFRTTIDAGRTLENQAPTLDPIADLVGTAGQPISLASRATDPDAGQALTFRLADGAPAGAAIDPATGIFLWTPTAAGMHRVTILVSDNASPPAVAMMSFSITVVAIPPVIMAGPDATLSAGSPFGRAGSIIAANPGPFAATVDYGDGTAPTPLVISPDGTFSLDHAYLAGGPYLVKISVVDGYGGLGTAQFSVNALAAPIIAPAPAPSPATGPSGSPALPASGFGAGFDAFVRTLYRDLLGHDPDLASLTRWAKKLARGKATAATVAASIWKLPEAARLRRNQQAPVANQKQALRHALAVGRAAGPLTPAKPGRSSKPASRG